MKKTYMKPALEQVVIETQRLMAASDPIKYSDDETQVESATLMDGVVGGSNVDVLSKDNDFDLWDEE